MIILLYILIIHLNSKFNFNFIIVYKYIHLYIIENMYVEYISVFNVTFSLFVLFVIMYCIVQELLLYKLLCIAMWIRLKLFINVFGNNNILGITCDTILYWYILKNLTNTLYVFYKIEWNWYKIFKQRELNTLYMFYKIEWNSIFKVLRILS